MATTVVELRAERAKLVAQARALHDKATAEKRDMSAEERAQFDQMMADVDALKKRVDDLEKLTAAEGDVSGDPAADPAAPPARADRQPGEQRDQNTRPQLERRTGESQARYEARCHRATPEYRAAFNALLCRGWNGLTPNESRAIQADINSVGGFLMAPQNFVNELLQALDSAVFLRSKATKYTVAGAQSLGVPSLDTDVEDLTWTSEIAAADEDTALAFGKRELYPHALAKLVKASNKLLRSAVKSPDAIVRERLAYKRAATEESAFLTGNGVNQPLGAFTASAMGVSTGRDVTITVTDDTTLANSLIDMAYSLKPGYLAKAEWVAHKDFFKRVRKIKDANNQWLWQPGLQPGQPDTLLSRPVNASDFAPATFTANLYVAMLADWSFYYIADDEDISIQVLRELYAATNQTGFICRSATDGMPALEEAFARGKCSGTWA
jgi:HK97 family phage major capsid protein